MEEDVEEDVVDSNTCDPHSTVEIMSYDRPPSAPPPPSSPLSVEIPIYSPFDEPPQYEPLTAAPVYKLISDYVRVKVGESHRVGFTVTSEPPVPLNSHHVITLRDGSVASSRFKVKDNFIVFDSVRETDTDIYCISCKNEAGLEGNAVIQLEVFTEYASSHAAAASLNSSRIGSQPTSSRFEYFRTEQNRSEAKSTLKKYFTINVILIFLGPIFFCGLPFWIGVIIFYCCARRKYHKGDYAETKNLLGGGRSCFVYWMVACASGIVVVSLALGLSLM